MLISSPERAQVKKGNVHKEKIFITLIFLYPKTKKESWLLADRLSA